MTFQSGVRLVYRSIVPERLRAGMHVIRADLRRRRWESVKQSRSYLYKNIEPGLKMKLYGDSVLCEMLYYWEFEPETRSFLNAFLRPGQVFLDVGANVGLFTLIAARLVGREGRVHAFEPVSRTHERLTANVQLNRLANVTCHRFALSDSNGAAVMTIATDGYDAWSSLGKPYMGSDLESETVTTCTLDDFVRQNGLSGKISVIKIDVEGWEARVLAGGRRTLSSPDAPLLIVEFTEQAAALTGSCCRALYEALREFGYRMFTAGPDTMALTEIFPLETFPNVNVLATKNSAKLVLGSKPA